jgi:hypothetical protein
MNRIALKLTLAGIMAMGVRAHVTGQAPAWIAHWSSAQAQHNQNGFQLALTSNGDILCNGGQGASTFSMNGHLVVIDGYSDMIIAKLNSDGIAQWLYQAGGDCPPYDGESANWIALTEQENAVYSLGWFQSPVALFGDTFLTGGCNNEHDLFITRNSVANGDFEWARAIRGTYIEPSDILLEDDETAWVFGHSDWADIQVQQSPLILLLSGAFLVKYNAQGQVLEAERIMLQGTIHDADWSGQNLLIGGSYSGQDSLWDIPLSASSVVSDGFIGKVDQSGVPQWITTLRADSMALVKMVAQLSDGSVIAAGYFSHRLVVDNDTLLTTGAGWASAFIASFSPVGELNWILPIESDSEFGNEGLFDLQIGPDDAIYLQGRFSGTMSIGSAEFTATAGHEMYVAKLNSTGACTAMLRMGRISLAVGGGSVVPVSGAVFVSATFDSTMVVGDMIIEPDQIGISDFFVAKFDSISGFTGINSMPQQEGELRIYANPNNGLCTIELPQSLRMTHDLVLSVFDNTGQLVQRIPLTAGSEGIRLDIRAQAKGIYHVELGDGEQRYSGTIVFE